MDPTVTIRIGHFSINGPIDVLVQPHNDSPALRFGGNLGPGVDAKSIKIEDFFILPAWEVNCVDAAQRSKNKYGRAMMVSALRVVSQMVKTFRPGIQIFELDFTRVTGARGAEKIHRSVKYDISGDRPRLLHHHEGETHEATH